MKCLLIILSIAAAVTGAVAQVASHTPMKFDVPSAQLPAPTGKVVVRVNGAVLTDRDLLREEYAIFPYARQHNGMLPQSMEPSIRQGAMEMIVFEELAYQDAKKQGYTITPQRLAKAEKDFRGRFSSEDEYRQFIEVDFQGNPELLRERIRRSLLIDKYLKIKVTQPAAVTPAELKAKYQASLTRYSYPESFAIQTVSVMPPVKATQAQLEDARKRAEEALKQAKATQTAEQFGLLAEKISEDDYRVMMGDHKWVGRENMPPEMLQAALKMKNGDVSELIKVGPNYVVFRLNGHVRPGTYKFDEVKEDLRKELEQKKTEQLRSALNKKLRQNAKVETL